MKRTSLINAFGNILPTSVAETTETFEHLINASRGHDLSSIDPKQLFDLAETQEVESSWVTKSSITNAHEVHTEILDRANNTIEYRIYTGFSNETVADEDNNFTYYDPSECRFTHKEATKVNEEIKKLVAF